MTYQQLGLFDDSGENQISQLENNSQLTAQKLSLNNANITFYPNFFNEQDSDYFLQELTNNIQWKQTYITLYGRTHPVPRLTAWYGDEGKTYTYSHIEMNPHPWIDSLLTIKHKIESVTTIEFNSVLLNLYRNGKDSVAWHSDDEPELGENPVIASVSFGATRRFLLRAKQKQNQDKPKELLLSHGSFLLMDGNTQKYWQHQIPKTSQNVKPRINLTFRVIH